MMSSIRTLLVNDSEIAAIVGTKVYVGLAAKEVEAPYLLLDEIFKNPNDCKVELSVVDSYMFAVTAVDTMYSTVETLLNRVRVVLDGHKDSYYRGVSFAGIQDHYDGTQDYFVNSNNYKSLINVL